MVSAITAPAGFIQDDENGDLFWGDKIEKETHSLMLTWNSDDGVVLHTEIADSFDALETLELVQDLTKMAARIMELDQ